MAWTCDALLDQAVGDLRVGRGRRSEVLAVRQLAGDDLVAARGCGGRDGLDVLLVDLPDELGIGDRLAGRGLGAAADHLHEDHEPEQDAHPDEQALCPGIRRLFLVHLASLGGTSAIVRTQDRRSYLNDNDITGFWLRRGGPRHDLFRDGNPSGCAA